MESNTKNAADNTGTADEPVGGPGSSQNLAVLKGITIGLGVLLVAGTIGIAFRIATLASAPVEPGQPGQTNVSQPASFVSAPTTQALEALPALPLRSGESIVSVNAGEGMVIVLVSTGPSPAAASGQRVLFMPLRDGAVWTELQVGVARE